MLNDRPGGPIKNGEPIFDSPPNLLSQKGFRFALPVGRGIETVALKYVSLGHVYVLLADLRIRGPDGHLARVPESTDHIGHRFLLSIGNVRGRKALAADDP